MASNFLKVSCRDCGNESTVFSRATTAISCDVCSAVLTKPAGGKADLSVARSLKPWNEEAEPP